MTFKHVGKVGMFLITIILSIMKIKYIVLVVLSVLVILFFAQIIRLVKKFKSIGEQSESIAHVMRPIIAKNIRTSTIDTIYLDNLTLLNFWATWCKPCIEEQASLELLSKRFPTLNIIQFSEEPIIKQKRFIDLHQWSLPAYLKDSAFSYKPTLLPTTLIIKNKEVISNIAGKRSWADSSFVAYIDSLLH
jgi:thiol-disulfide isomerase/thioredoxin